MESGALSDEKFGTWAKDFVLLCHITSKVESDKDQDLLQEKGGRGFPYLVYMDGEGAIVGKHRDARTADGFERGGRKAKAYVEYKKKADAGDKAARTSLALAQLDLELDSTKLDKARQIVKDLGNLTKEQQAMADGLLATLEAGEIFGKVRRSRESQVEAGKKLAEMKMGGRVPADFYPALQFWYYITMAAEEDKDVAAFEEALRALRVLAGDDPGVARMLEEREKKLAELRGDGK